MYAGSTIDQMRYCLEKVRPWAIQEKSTTNTTTSALFLRHIGGAFLQEIDPQSNLRTENKKVQRLLYFQRMKNINP